MVHKAPVGRLCPYCGEEAPYGDERHVWLNWHYSTTHRSWCFIQRSLVRGLIFGGRWIRKIHYNLIGRWRKIG